MFYCHYTTNNTKVFVFQIQQYYKDDQLHLGFSRPFYFKNSLNHQLSKQNIIRPLTTPPNRIQRIESFHVPFLQLEIRELKVLLHPLHRRGLSNWDNAMLRHPLETNLRRGLPVLLCHGYNCWMLEHRGTAHWAPRLHCNVMIFAVAQCAALIPSRVEFNLVHHGRDFAAVEDWGNVL